jgi:hypothetical protein
MACLSACLIASLLVCLPARPPVCVSRLPGSPRGVWYMFVGQRALRRRRVFIRRLEKNLEAKGRGVRAVNVVAIETEAANFSSHPSTTTPITAATITITITKDST